MDLIAQCLFAVSLQQGSKLTVLASGKFVILKSCLLPIEKVGSKKLLPGHSVTKVISGK